MGARQVSHDLVHNFRRTASDIGCIGCQMRRRPVPTARAHLSSDARCPQHRHRVALIGIGARQRIAVAVHPRLGVLAAGSLKRRGHTLSNHIALRRLGFRLLGAALLAGHAYPLSLGPACWTFTDAVALMATDDQVRPAVAVPVSYANLRDFGPRVILSDIILGWTAIRVAGERVDDCRQ